MRPSGLRSVWHSNYFCVQQSREGLSMRNSSRIRAYPCRCELFRITPPTGMPLHLRSKFCGLLSEEIATDSVWIRKKGSPACLALTGFDQLGIKRELLSASECHPTSSGMLGLRVLQERLPGTVLSGQSGADDRSVHPRPDLGRAQHRPCRLVDATAARRHDPLPGAGRHRAQHNRIRVVPRRERTPLPPTQGGHRQLLTAP